MLRTVRRASGTPRVLWRPDAARVAGCELSRFADRVSEKFSLAPFASRDRADYERLRTWSNEHAGAFWGEVWDHVGFVGERTSESVAPADASWSPLRGVNPAAAWFPGASTNHAENLLAHGLDDAPALIFASERPGPAQVTTYKQLRRRVAATAAALRADGVGPGDVCAGFVANTPDAVVAMLATTSLGAAWACCSPDFGERGVVDRLGQVRPKVLFAHDRYSYKGRVHATLPKLDGAVSEALRDCTQRTVVLDYPCDDDAVPELPADSVLRGAVRLADYVAPHLDAPLVFDRGSFERPVYIMFSSGTTGAPKCMAQGCGVTLNHAKEAALHFDISREERVFWFTTTGWMMWQWLVGAALSRGAAAVLYDGDPMHPSPSRLWDLASETQVDVFGTSARWLSACGAQSAAASPQRLGLELPRLRAIGSTGSPAGGNVFAWAHEEVVGVGGAAPQFVSTSGGTDLNGSFVTGNPWLPVHEGELQCLALGLDATVLDEAGERDLSATGETGELACRRAFPSAPLEFLGDGAAARKYREAYFSADFGGGGVWRHGDFCSVNPSTGGVTIHGRSDATLNPGGVRIGTAELYRALEELASSSATPLFEDALVVGQPVSLADGTPDVRVVLFLVLADGSTGAAPAATVRAVRDHVRAACSPRHVPAVVCCVNEIPYTTNGKKVEIAVIRALTGKPVTNRSALANPHALDFFQSDDCLALLDRLAVGTAK